MRRKVSKLSPNEQRMLSQKIYKDGYEALKNNKGNCLGACSVVFECRDEKRVRYYVGQMLTKREEDAEDPMMFGELQPLKHHKWVVSVVVCSDTHEHAMYAADACIMSAVLSVDGIKDTFVRYMNTIATQEDEEMPTREECFEIIHNTLSSSDSIDS
jgi:hypothetical protein